MLLILPEAGSKMDTSTLPQADLPDRGRPMDKNFFLLYNEIVYHIHTCEDIDDLSAPSWPG